MEEQTPPHSDAQDRLSRISAQGGPRRFDERRSSYIRWIKLVLPMIALSLVALVFVWGSLGDEKLVPVVEEAEAPKTIGKNELLNPRFESMDQKKQPYTITAKRALQGESNENLVMLDEPVADMMLNSGNWVAVEAQQGALRQDNLRLLLQGDVKIFHDDGYSMEMAALNLDLENSTAWSETTIYGQGPAGILHAKGLQADTKKGLLIFNGPAKLILNKTVKNPAGE